MYSGSRSHFWRGELLVPCSTRRYSALPALSPAPPGQLVYWPLLYGKQVDLARAGGQAWLHAALTGQGNLATVVPVSASLEGATAAAFPSHAGPQVEVSGIILEPRRCHLYLHASRPRYHYYTDT